MSRNLLVLYCLVQCAVAQEASSGFEVATTLSAGFVRSPLLSAPPRDGSPATGGFRAIIYPTWKLNRDWTVFAAVQVHSRPYFYEELQTQGNGVKADFLQAHISYARYWNRRSLVFRAGQLSSAFGAFLLRYDDAVNPLIDMPVAYGYYYRPVTTLGMMGAQVDATLGKLDARLQYTNSSPANRRSIFDSDQYGTWTAGAGLTIRQGLRVGVSTYRGAYLHRNHRFYFPGEARPRDLPATAFGTDVQLGAGHWNFNGEWQKFNFDYRAIPVFTQHMGYGEARVVLHPRWYAATRMGYLRASAYPGYQVFEMSAGFRPNVSQLIKVGYQIQQGPTIPGTSRNVFAVQLVSTFRPVSISRD